MTKKIVHRRYQRPQAGFGIIEIMIAMALGIIIMLGVTQVATSNSETRYELERATRQIENAAYALREMENDITNAGYWGEMGAQPFVTLPAVCPAQACDREADADLSGADCELNWAMSTPVQGGSGVFACGNLGSITPKTDTDYIAVRRANSCALGSTGCDASDDPADNNIHLAVHSCFDPNSVFDPIPYRLGTNATELAKSKVRGGNCATAAAAPRYRFLNRVYYVNNDDQLVRAELVGAQYVQTVLVDGVESMRLEYGMDRSVDLLGDSVVVDGQVDDDINGYTPQPTSDMTGDPPEADKFPDSAWGDVVMVRISLVVRNIEPSNGFVDSKAYKLAGEDYDVPAEFQSHRRQVYARTVSVRNVAGRRE